MDIVLAFTLSFSIMIHDRPRIRIPSLADSKPLELFTQINHNPPYSS